MFCTDYDANVDAIVDLLELLGDLPTYADCGKCVAIKNPVTCLKCLASLVLDGLIDLNDYPCIFVNECQMCHSVDVECSTPHKETVVDWEVMTGVVPSCILGINYP